jgi:large subunit ribosomal protein L31
MKEGIHPKYREVTAKCTCGVSFETSSIKDLHVDSCSSCHPYFTGKTKADARGGQVDKFKQRFGKKS